MADVFVRLARRLDRLPNGFPATADGVELAILRKLFTAEEAAWALRLKPIPETAATIARRLRVPVAEVRDTLDAMAARGLIASFKMRGVVHYALVPFIIGIYEFQLQRLDRDLAELFEAYAPTLLATLGGAAPALARVVPVNIRLETRPAVLPYEDLRAMLDACRSFRVAECLCRKERGLLGKPCRHPAETCLSFARDEGAYQGMPPWGRVISKEEAFDVLDLAEREGLVHCTYNFQRDPFFVCNCCSCCCGFLRGVKEFGAPYVLAPSSLVATIHRESCSECGECTARCPMGAIAAGGDGLAVDAQRCVGCGLCATSCPSDAVALAPRPATQQPRTPTTIVDWSVERMTHRRGPLHGLALRGWLAWEGLKMLATRRTPGGS